MAKDIKLPDFLTESEIKQVVRIYKQHKDDGAAAKICKEVIEPNLERINESLGQENDPSYLAYACEYVMMRTGQ